MNASEKIKLGKRVVKRGITYVWSEELQLMFRAGVGDPRNARLEMLASAFEELHRQYAVKPRRKLNV